MLRKTLPGGAIFIWPVPNRGGTNAGHPSKRSRAGRSALTLQVDHAAGDRMMIDSIR
jgi:hypothetical protein